MAQRIEFQFVGDPSDLVDAFKQVAGAAKNTEQAAKKNEGAWARWDGQVQKTSKVIGAAATMVARYTAGLGAAVGAMVLLSAKTAEADRVLGDFADRMGTDVETLSALRYAAESVGLDFEELERGTRKLGQGLAEMAAGGTSETAEAMRSLGLQGTDLLENLGAVADAFADMEAGAEKTTLAMRLFGEESGPRMLEFLNQGSEGIARLKREAHALGATIRNEDVVAATEFRAAMAELKTSSGALAAEFGRAMLPRLIEIARATLDVVNLFREWAGLTRAQSSETMNSVDAIEHLNRRILEVRAQLEEVNRTTRAAVAVGGPVPQSAIDMADQLAAKLQDLEDRQKQRRDELRIERRQLREIGAAGVATYESIGDAAEGAGEAVAEVLQENQKLLAGMKQAKIDGVAAAEEEADRLQQIADETADAQIAAMERAQQKRERIEEESRRTQAEARDYSIQIAQEIGDFLIRINEEAQAARQQEVDRVASRINDTERALAEATNERDRDTLRRRLRNLRDQEAEAVKLAREEWRRGQALMVAQAAIGTAASIVQAIGSTPPPYSYILAGISAAMGTANMIAIAAQPQPFHTGGMVRDEVTIRARSGEAVLSPQGVSQIGGADAVAELNRGRGGGPSPVVIVQKLDHKVYNAQTTQALRRQGSALTTAIRAAQPRAIGRNNPYRSS